MLAVYRAERLAGWMRRQLVASGARGFVLGLDGGVNAAVVLRLAQLAAPNATLGAILPCHSDPLDEEDAVLAASHFSAATVRIDLSDAYDALVAALQPGLLAVPKQGRAGGPHGEPDGRGALAAIKPRLRMATLYYLAGSLNYLVAGTSNRSELAIGAFTKHGDGAADLLPIGRLATGAVRTMAGELGVPATMVARSGAGVRIGRTGEDDRGFTYDELERYLDQGADTVPPALAMKIERLIRASDHKRQLPPMPEPE
jgi:NAD+ synthase